MSVKFKNKFNVTGAIGFKQIVQPTVLDGVNFYTYEDSLELVDYIGYTVEDLILHENRNFQLVTYNSAQYLVRYVFAYNSFMKVFIHEPDPVTRLPKPNYVPKHYRLETSAFATVWLDFEKGRGVKCSVGRISIKKR